MTNEITAEEMVGAAIETTAFNVCHIFESDPKVADMELVRHELRSLSEAIRKHLEKPKPRVSRRKISYLYPKVISLISIKGDDFACMLPFRKEFKQLIANWLTELGIEVED